MTMRTTPRTRRWAVLGATAALASAAFALPALAQGSDEAPGARQPDWAGNAEPGERHAEMVAELEGLDGDAVVERLEELHAEREAHRAERFAERETERAERFTERETERAERFTERETERAERFAEVVAELEGLEGEELTEKLEELHAERQAFRAERQADREQLHAERQAFRAERPADGAGRGVGPRMGPDED